MTRPRLHSPAAVLAVVLALAAAPAGAQTGGHAGHGRPAATARAKDYVDADVHFMVGMIHHHQQALEMAAMAPTHTSNERLQLLAKKIDLSQRDEIASMTQWLEDRKIPLLPDAHAHHDANAAAGAAGAASATGAMDMPGMLSPEQMAQLGRARGGEFDRLFLEFMIQHHLGALQMVKELYEAPGAGQEPVLFQFASDVDADQRAEIDLMQRLLDTLPNPRSQTR